MIGVLNSWRKRNNILPAGVLVLGGPTSAFLWVHSMTISVFVAAITVFAAYMELMTQLAFRAPSIRKPKLLDEVWNPKPYTADGIEMFTNHAQGEPGRPTVWICHGWTSGSQRMVGRASTFLEKGWSVVMVDLPNHGGSGGLTKWTAEQSCTLAMKTMNRLAHDVPTLFAGPIYYYGHSMGAFIGLRVSKRRPELSFGDRLAGWVFESPMTGYTEIFRETCRLLRIPSPLQPMLLRKTIRQVNAINARPEALVELIEADMPLWGMPSEPVLLVQAQPDDRLGDAHHVRLVKTMQAANVDHLLTKHYLPSLTHSGSATHEERDGLVAKWVDVHSSSK